MHITAAAMQGIVTAFATASVSAFLVPVQFSTWGGLTRVQATATDTAAGSARVCQSSYWEQTHPEVPSEYLQCIRDEPWRGGLEPATDHALAEVAPEQIQGQVPAGLEGTLFRNGPGRIRFKDGQYGHWFDGDGHISKVVISGGKVYAQNAFVRTEAFKAQEATGDPYAVRRAWTQRAGGLLANAFRIPANPVNTHVQVTRDGELWALCEGGPPFRMDPVTLETGESYDFHGQLTSCYSAHPSIDPATGHIFNTGLQLRPPFAMAIMHADAAGNMINQTTVKVNHMVHDNVLTKDYFAFFVPPYRAPSTGFLKSILGFGSLVSYYEWHPEEGTEVVIVRRDDLSIAARVNIPAVSLYHFINAYQDEQGRLVVLADKHRGNRRPELEEGLADLYHQRLDAAVQCDIWAYTFDVEGGELLSARPVAQTGDALPHELPRIDHRFTGKRTKYAFTNSLLGDAGFVNAVSMVNLESGEWHTHTFGASRYAGEPVFIPREEGAPEGDGFVMTIVYNTENHTSDIVLLDTNQFTGQPVFVAHLPHHLPYSFHGRWTERTFLRAIQ